MFEEKPLILSRKLDAVLFAILVGVGTAAFYSRAQPQSEASIATQPSASAATSPINPNLVVIDPAHGGPDAGATLGDKILEKDVTLAITARLRAALTAAGFTVVTTRDADLATPLTGDQRAEIANRAHALACLVIHATASGSGGVHLYTSALPPTDSDEGANGPATSPSAFIPVPWERSQAGFVRQSQRLASDLSAALGKANLPVLTGREPLRPLDNMECTAVAIEMAPLQVAGGDITPVTDANYQQGVAAALTTALTVWRDNANPSATHAVAPVGGGTKAIGPAVLAQTAAQAAGEAGGRATATRVVPKLTADKSHAASRSPVGGQSQTNEVQANSTGSAVPASSSSGTDAAAPQSGGAE